MLALWIIGGLVLLFVLLGQLRVGVLASFGEALSVAVRIGPVTKQIIPAPAKKPKAKKKETPAQEKPAGKKEKRKLGLTFAELRAALSAVWQGLQNGLRQTRRRVRIDPLQLSLTVGDDDPAMAAEVYGWLSAAVWTVMPRLESLSQLPHPYIHTGVDFSLSATRAEGTVGVSFRIHDLLAIGAAMLGPVLRWGIPFLRAKKAKEAAAKRAAAQPETAEKQAAQEATKIA